MTQDILVLMISAFCGFKDPKISQQTKVDCMEFMVNCSIIKENVEQVTEKRFDECQSGWIRIQEKSK